MTEPRVPYSRIFLALLMRDVTVARREIVYFLVRTTLQPLLFVLIFGLIMPRMGIVGRAYTTMMLPGILALSLALSAVQAVSLPMVQEFGWTKEIEDRLLAPISNQLVAVEKIVAGTLQGIVAAIFVLPISRLIMGPIPGLTFRNVGMLFVMTILSGAAFSAIGLFIGTAIAPQQIGLMFSVIIAPMIMFGCTYYPWRGLDAVPAMKWLVLIDPLVYVSEGLRSVLTPSVPHMPQLAIVAALLLLAILFTWLGVRSFMKRAMS